MGLGQLFANRLPAWFSMVKRNTIKADLTAGLTNAVIVLPQGVAFSLIAGLPPEYGLYTAIVMPIVAAFFGSSLHQISGPTTPNSLLVFATISQLAEPGSTNYIALALLLTFLVGVIQLGFGLARMGVWVNFVSSTVVVAFTAGAAFLIANSQMKHFLGINIKSSVSFVDTLTDLARHIESTNLNVLLVASATLFSAIIFRKLIPKYPYLLLSMLLGGVLAYFLGGEQAGIHNIGAIPSALPKPVMHTFSWPVIKSLMPNAFALALLGLIQTIAIAKSIALLSGQRIDSNQEFIGQGMGNLIGSFFSAYAGAGSFTRSGVNFQAGAKTPMSAIFAALLLFLMLLLIGPFVSYIPIPAMAGVILLVAFNLIEFQKIKKILKTSRLESTVLAVTFFSTLLFDLEYAIMFGAATSLAYFLFKISRPHIAVMAPDPDRFYRFTYILRKPELKECPYVKVVRIDGPVFYGNIEHIGLFFDEIHQQPYKNCLIFAEGINFIGMAGAEFLVNEAKRWKAKGGGLYFANLKVIAQDVLVAGGYKAAIGEDHFFQTKTEAFEYLHRGIDRSICEVCKNRKDFPVVVPTLDA